MRQLPSFYSINTGVPQGPVLAPALSTASPTIVIVGVFTYSSKDRKKMSDGEAKNLEQTGPIQAFIYSPKKINFFLDK